MSQNIIQEKSFAFALRILEIVGELQLDKEYTLSNQLLKSGTSIGAMVEESIGAESTKDFIHKLSVANKEARETRYWILLLVESRKINKESAQRLISDVEEILKILTSILKKMKAKR